MAEEFKQYELDPVPGPEIEDFLIADYNGLTLIDGDLQTANYTPQSTGTLISSTGVIEINDPVILSGGFAKGTDIAMQGWTYSGAFSVTDADTVSWGSGTFLTGAGDSYSIGAGNTGAMTDKTYIYLDLNTSETTFQTSTTSTDAVGAAKVLLAIAEDGTNEATLFFFGDGSGNIQASSIAANSITANELATSITYAGTIVIDTAGKIRSGQTAYNTGTGWFIGNDSGTAKLSIGDPDGKYLLWTGSDLDSNVASNVLFIDTSDTTVTATTTETSIFSGTVPGGSLGTGNVLRAQVSFSMQSNNGDDFTIRLKYGATTMLTATGTPDGNTGTLGGQINILLAANGATNSQKAYLTMVGAQGNLYTSDVGASTSDLIHLFNHGTAAEDSTADKTLNVTIQFETNNAANSITQGIGIAEIIR